MGAKRRGATGGRSGEKRGRREIAAELCAALGDAALRERAAAAWAGGEPLRHGTGPRVSRLSARCRAAR